MPIPAKPVASGAPSLAPAQGDHVFGDAIGMVNGALGELFGGLQGWEAHMQNYNPLLRASWTTMSNMDLGHILGPNQPLVRRGGAAEPDEHAHMFGGYADRFRWQLTQLPHNGFVGKYFLGQWGSYAAWRRKVLSAFDDVMTHAVDSTALNAYLADPQATRAAAPLLVRHPVISILTARTQAAGHGVNHLRIRTICNNFIAFRSQLEGLLLRFDHPVP